MFNLTVILYISYLKDEPEDSGLWTSKELPRRSIASSNKLIKDLERVEELRLELELRFGVKALERAYHLILKEGRDESVVREAEKMLCSRTKSKNEPLGVRQLLQLGMGWSIIYFVK